MYLKPRTREGREAEILLHIAESIDDIEHHQRHIEELLSYVRSGERRRLTRKDRIEADVAYRWVQGSIKHLEEWHHIHNRLRLDVAIPVIIAKLKEQNAEIESALWPRGRGAAKKRPWRKPPFRPVLAPCAGGILSRQSTANAASRRSTGQRRGPSSRPPVATLADDPHAAR